MAPQGTRDFRYRNDRHQIIARIAVIPEDKRGNIGQRSLSDFLLENPLYVTLDDSTLVAHTTMLDHGISWLPVVQSNEDPRPVGCLRGDKISDRLFQEIGQMETIPAQVAS